MTFAARILACGSGFDRVAHATADPIGSVTFCGQPVTYRDPLGFESPKITAPRCPGCASVIAKLRKAEAVVRVRRKG